MTDKAKSKTYNEENFTTNNQIKSEFDKTRCPQS